MAFLWIVFSDTKTISRTLVWFRYFTIPREIGVGTGSPVLFVLHKPCKSLQSGRMFDKSLCVGAASAAGSPFKRIR